MSHTDKGDLQEQKPEGREAQKLFQHSQSTIIPNRAQTSLHSFTESKHIHIHTYVHSQWKT